MWNCGKSQLKYSKNLRFHCIQKVIRASLSTLSHPPNSEKISENLQDRLLKDWETAKEFSEIPGPSHISFIASFLPGGKYYNKTLIEIYQNLRREYGDIVLIPGLFGKRNVIVTFDPEDFEKVFRTEGTYPIRRGLDSITYYRKVERADFYKNAGGLVAEQGECWADFRSKVNPIMIKPKTVKQYIPHIDEVAREFVERIRKVRNPITNEVPSNFDEEIHHWTLESVGLLALDTRFGLLKNALDENPHLQEVIEAIISFFGLLYELDIKPSMWKFVTTPKFKKMVKIQDFLIAIITKYIDNKLKDNEDGDHIIGKQLPEILTFGRKHDEKSVLEKLIEIDKQVAIVMAMDMIIAGVDTTTSAFVGNVFQLSRNPDKQEELRRELKRILPNKDTSLNVDNMNNAPYLRACIKESLRLHPVTVGNFRTTGQNIVLSGYRVPKGQDISMASLVLQRDNNYFPEALKFLPERWLRGERYDNGSNSLFAAKNTHPFIYLPFGFGPRMCIGKRFVELELEVALARIFRNFSVEHHYKDIIFKTNVTNCPFGDFRFRFIDSVD